MANKSLSEDMQISASAGWIRITWRLEPEKWTQMNFDLATAEQLVTKLRNAINAAKFLSEQEKNG